MAECWCCGTEVDAARVVRLGNHPEVTLCLACARWTGKQADAIDDLDRRGAAVVLRNRARAVRRIVVERGWHRLPVIGGALRWLGRHTP